MARVENRAMPMPRTTAAQERARAEAKIDALKVSAATKRAAKQQLRAAIGVYTKCVDDAPVGASRYGGTPDLPAGVPWPRAGPYPMTFVAQLDLADVTAFDVDGRLPARGLLSLFVHDWLPEGATEPRTYSTACVQYVENPRGLARAALPKEFKRYKPFGMAALRFHTTFQLPSHHTGVEVLVDPWTVTAGMKPNAGQLLGYDSHAGYDPPLPAGTSPLVRCESVGTWINFGDAQPISYRIADADLAAGRLDRATLWLQAG